MATLERDATWGMLNRRKAQTISDDAIQLLNIRVPHAQCAPADCPAATSRSC